MRSSTLGHIGMRSWTTNEGGKKERERETASIKGRGEKNSSEVRNNPSVDLRVVESLMRRMSVFLSGSRVLFSFSAAFFFFFFFGNQKIKNNKRWLVLEWRSGWSWLGSGRFFEHEPALAWSGKTHENIIHIIARAVGVITRKRTCCSAGSLCAKVA